MEADKIRQLSTPVNGRLRRRTWIAVAVVVMVLLGLAKWSNDGVRKTAEIYERHRIVGESLAHVERQVMLEKLTKIQKALEEHGNMKIDTSKVKEVDSLYLDN